MTDGSRGKVLIIEDTAGYRRIYQDVLSADGYEVVDADDGSWGLQLALSEKPDLVLLDLVLPGMSGFDVLKELRENPTTADVPVIVFSVLGEGKDIRRARDLGANDYAVKGSVSPREMVRRVRQMLEMPELDRLPEHTTKYRVSVQPMMGDASRLAQDLNLGRMLTCPQCNKEVVLELARDPARPDGHWYLGHFVCPVCETELPGQ